MKTKNYLWILSIAAISISSLYISGCTDEDNPPDPTIDNSKSYFVGGSYGDIINYTLDAEKKTYSYTNITTNASGNGSFVLSANPKLEGVYEFNSGNDFFYGVELPGKLFATSLPSGNTKNRLCFGISSDDNLAIKYTTEEIAGKYIWIIYNDLSEFEWGGYEIKTDGTFTWASGPEDDKDFDEITTFKGEGNGTWEIDPNNPSTIIFTEDGVQYVGTLSPNKYMIIDNGPGKGFLAGIKYPDQPISQASIAGTYQQLNVTPEGYLGVGSFNITATENDCFSYYKYYNNPYANEGTVEMKNFKRSDYINNAFISEGDFDGDTFYTSFIVLPGEALLFFTWGDNGMVSYGIGGKIN